MLKSFPIRATDLRAYSRLAIDATLAVTDLLENMHHNISRLPGVFAAPTTEPARGITGFVYRSIRGITRKVGVGIDAVLRTVTPESAPDSRCSARSCWRRSTAWSAITCWPPTIRCASR